MPEWLLLEGVAGVASGGGTAVDVLCLGVRLGVIDLDLTDAIENDRFLRTS